MTCVRNVRRFYLGKRYEATFNGDLELACVWQAKQEAEPGTVLPALFPVRALLAEAGYTTDADLNGATVSELEWAGLSTQEAEAVLSAYAAL